MIPPRRPVVFQMPSRSVTDWQFYAVPFTCRHGLRTVHAVASDPADAFRAATLTMVLWHRRFDSEGACGV